MSKLSRSVLTSIHKKHLKPLPRWVFVLRYGSIWFFIGITAITAGIFIGTFLAQLQAAEWQLASRWPGQQAGFIRDAIGWLWGVSAIGAIAGSILLFRFTRHGYRYGGIAILLIFLASSSVLALLIFQTSLPHRLQGFHENLLPPRIAASQFHNPREGRLMGEIVEVERDTAFLQGVDGSTWELWLFDGQIIPEKTLVQVFGEPLNDAVFAVLVIRPVPPHYSVQEFPAALRMPR